MRVETWVDGRSRSRRVAAAVGSTFLVVGCLGFLPGATAHVEQLHLTGPGSPSALLGIVPVTVAGNVLHLAFALAAAACHTSDARARGYLVWGGAAYAVLCARSIAIGTGGVGVAGGGGGGLWLALAAGVGMTAAGWLCTGVRFPVVAPVARFRHPG